MFGYSKEAVRVKVKKCEGKLQPELRKFSVDPQITSLEVLQSILTKAFDIKSDFTLSYRTVDESGQEIYLPLLSDWDLDAAFLKAHNIALTHRSEPCVQLKVDMKPFAEATEDWEPNYVSTTIQNHTQNSKDQPNQAPQLSHTEKQDIQTGLQGMIMNQLAAQARTQYFVQGWAFQEFQKVLRPYVKGMGPIVPISPPGSSLVTAINH